MAIRKISKSAVSAQATADEKEANTTDHGRSVAMNLDALQVMATSGRAKAEVLFPAFYLAYTALGKPKAAAKLNKLEDQPSTLPSMLDVQRWLDNVVENKDVTDVDGLVLNLQDQKIVAAIYQLCCDSTSSKFQEKTITDLED
jgi:hypothetical protein